MNRRDIASEEADWTMGSRLGKGWDDGKLQPGPKGPLSTAETHDPDTDSDVHTGIMLFHGSSGFVSFLNTPSILHSLTLVGSTLHR